MGVQGKDSKLVCFLKKDENGSVVHFDLVHVGAITRSQILENVGFGESVIKIQDFLDQSG